MIERFALARITDGWRVEDIMKMVEESLLEKIAPNEEQLLHPTIDAAIEMERKRGMPERFTRKSGLVFFRITVEEVR